ncbi:MAG: rod shape-determining protein RodA [Crocinitomicaceae bacterium]|nr:rod shape-determining protein RodA [Crocinitomicaceae bacterium]
MKNNKLKNTGVERVDWITVIVYLFFVVFGWMNIYSAAYDHAHPNIFDFSQEYGKQFIWIIVSFLIAILTLYVEGDFFNKFSIYIYGFFTLLLVLVLIVGKEVNGAKAWFGVGDFGIQPSEFSKIGVGLLLAKYIASSGAKFKTWKTRLVAAAIIGFPAGLILLQPDVGSVLTFVAFILVMYREGLSGNVLILGLGAIVFGVLSIVSGAGSINFPFVGEQSGVWLLILIVLLLGIIWWLYVRNFIVPRNRKPLYWIIATFVLASSLFSFSVSYIVDNVLEQHHKERIYVMLSLPVEREGADYNSEMAKITVGSGGFLGRGYLEGPMTQNNYVPEQWTDFIFSAVAEEWGFWGGTLIIGLFVFLIIRLINMAERQRSQFSRVYGYCVACIFFMHLLINVGMVIGLAPIIGIPLPFFSYGGSSLMGFTLLLFIMLRLDAERLSIFR